MDISLDPWILVRPVTWLSDTNLDLAAYSWAVIPVIVLYMRTR